MSTHLFSTSPQVRVPAVFMRGGTSKGVFFHERDLLASGAERAALLLAILGSPDPYRRQLDGMGGGVSSLSKAVILSKSQRADSDVDYTFFQIAIDRPLVDESSTCGNLASAVGPFAVDEGLVDAADGEACVRIFCVNTGKRILSRFFVEGGRAAVRGSLQIPGVAGSGSPVRLEFLDPGSSAGRGLLPAGEASTVLDGPFGSVRASMVDAATPCVFLRACDLGVSGAEGPSELEADARLCQLLEQVRVAAGERMGLKPAQAQPKVGIVSPPQNAVLLSGAVVEASEVDVTLRMFSMGQPHRAAPLTAALCLGVAAGIDGSVAHESTRAARSEAIRISTPSGVLSVAADIGFEGGWQAKQATVYRTARRLMEGAVFAPI